MFSAVILGLVALATLLWYCFPRKPHGFPPGPPGIPVFGALFSIIKLDKSAFAALRKLSNIYGPLVGLHLGKNLTLIVNEYENVKEVLNRDEFQGRPPLKILQELFKGKCNGQMFSNGDEWKEQRRFSLRHLRDFGFGKTSIEGLLHEEVEACHESLRKQMKESPDGVVQMANAFSVSIINVLWAMVSGKRYDHDDAEFNTLLQKVARGFRSGGALSNLINDYPFLKHFPVFRSVWGKLISGILGTHQLLDKAIDEHEKTRDPANSRDFVDEYLKEMERLENEGKLSSSSFSKEQLKAVCNDLFAAGAESTSNSLAFAMLHMIRNPTIQQKVHEELDRIVGKNRLPSSDDRANLPYIEAVLAEITRVSSVAPFTVPHYTLQEAKLRGYTLPKGTWVMINLDSVHKDVEFWGDPEVFRPERHLNESGQFVKSDRVIPFGLGRRMCLGESLARQEYFLFFTCMMQCFELSIPEGEPIPSIEPVDGFTVAPRPFKARLIERK